MFYSMKINRFCSHLQQINWNLGIVGYGLILIFDLNWIFHNILNYCHLLSTINSIFFFLTFSLNLWKVLFSGFNSTTCCMYWYFSTTSKLSLEIGNILSTLKLFSFLNTWLGCDNFGFVFGLSSFENIALHMNMQTYNKNLYII